MRIRQRVQTHARARTNSQTHKYRENKYIYCLSKITESYVQDIYVGPVQKGEYIMCAPSKDQALHQCGCFDDGMTCFGAIGNMPCLMIHHDLLEYLLS